MGEVMQHAKEIYLFRAAVFFPKQRSLLAPTDDPSELLQLALSERPSADGRGDATWHIGNVQQIDSDGWVARFGRTRSETVEKYLDGDFIDVEDENAPSTIVLMDTKIELIGIAPNWGLSTKTDYVASQFGSALNNSLAATNAGVDIEVTRIFDKRPFMQQMRSALRVTRFWMDISRPNIKDTDSDFIKMYRKVVRDKGGTEGKLDVRGQALEVAELEGFVSEAGRTGSNGGATMVVEDGSVKRRTFKKSPVIIPADVSLHGERLEAAMRKLRERYDNLST